MYVLTRKRRPNDSFQISFGALMFSLVLFCDVQMKRGSDEASIFAIIVCMRALMRLQCAEVNILYILFMEVNTS